MTAVVGWTTIERERDMSQPFDITDRRDVACLVNVFYDRVRDDDILGPIFDDIAHVDWATHLPRMYDFWESVLFARATFKGAPLVVHRALARHTPLTSTVFSRWITLFQSTVNDLFSGPMAEHAKNSAARIAATMEHNIDSRTSSSDASFLRDHKELVTVGDHNRSKESNDLSKEGSDERDDGAVGDREPCVADRLLEAVRPVDVGRPRAHSERVH